MNTASLFFSLVLIAEPATAQSYTQVKSRDELLTIFDGRNLTNRLYGIDLAVTPDGQIRGTGAGWAITGTWTWKESLFCREMVWGGDIIPYNCQLVEVADDQMRFTSDAGEGDSASFRLR